MKRWLPALLLTFALLFIAGGLVLVWWAGVLWGLRLTTCHPVSPGWEAACAEQEHILLLGEVVLALGGALLTARLGIWAARAWARKPG